MKSIRFRRLVGGELKKTLRQPGTAVLLALTLLASALMPFLLRPKYQPPDRELPDFADSIRTYEEMGHVAMAVEWKALAETADYFRAHGFDATSAEYRLLFNDCSRDAVFTAILRAYLDGTLTEAEAEDSYYRVSVETYTRLTGVEPLNWRQLVFPQWLNGSAADTLAEMEAVMEEWHDRLEHFDIRDYYADNIADLEPEYRLLAANADLWQTACSLMPDNDDARYYAEYYVALTKTLGASIDALKAMKDTAAPYEGPAWEAWQNLMQCFFRMQDANWDPMPEVPKSENLFFLGEEKDDYRNYATYVHVVRDFYAPRNERERTELLASVEHQIPLPTAYSAAEGTSVKTTLHTYLTLSAILCGAVMSLIACTSLAAEYSTGTLRLLLIRPVRRTRIILSKLASWGACGVTLTAASALLILAATLIGFGAGDVFVPDLMTLGGRVVALSPVLTDLAIVGGGLLLGSFWALLGLILTELTGSYLASAVPLAGILLAQTVQKTVVTQSISGDYGYWLKFTPLPYLFPAAFLGNVADAGLRTYGNAPSGFGLVQILNYADSCLWYRYEPWIGIAELAVLTLAALAAVIVVFDRRQIKN